MNFNKKSQARRWILICLAAIVSLLLYKFLPYDVNANKGLALLVFMALLWLTEALPITISALLVPILGALFAFPSEAVRDEVTNQLLPNWADIKPISFGAARRTLPTLPFSSSSVASDWQQHSTCRNSTVRLRMVSSVSRATTSSVASSASCWYAQCCRCGSVTRLLPL